jgi:hypothetical protein
MRLEWSGLIIGLITYLIIAIGHIIVIKGEYRFGVRIWFWFLFLGLASIAFSLLVSNKILSASLGILGFTFLWAIKELFEQRERVKKGLYPKNPERKN